MKKIFLFILLFSLSACNSTDKPIITDHPSPPKDPTQMKSYENEAFKDVTVNKTDNALIVTGKARVFEGVFQYAIKAGNEVLKETHYTTLGAPEWGDFSISIDKELADQDGASIELFVYSAKDGSKINSLEIPLNE